MVPYQQFSLADIFSDCQKIFVSDKPQFCLCSNNTLILMNSEHRQLLKKAFRKREFEHTETVWHS